MNKLLLSVFLGSLLFAVGCASDGGAKQEAKSEPPKDNRPLEEKLKTGMTKDEVRQAMGEPSGKTVNSKGEEIWNYSDNAKAWIPFYAVSGGKFEHTYITFDTEGKVKDWTTSKQAMY